MEILQVGELIGIVLVVVWAIKKAGLATKYLPLLAMILGLGVSLWLGGVSWVSTASGVLLGLATTLGYREVKVALK